MLVNKSYEINSCDDFELDIKRESKLEFKVCFDDEKEIEALLFVIPGLGHDTNENYREHLAQFSANEFNVAVVSVSYHCIGNRPQTGAKLELDYIDKLIWKESCKAVGFEIDVEKLTSFEAMCKNLEALNSFLQSRYTDLNLSITFCPTKNEYQNFGIMQALDILNALLFVRKNPPFKIAGGGLAFILLGSSHGGYLAHLCAKIAPWLVDGVIDNSGYAKFLWRLVGAGKELDFIKYPSAPNSTLFSNIRICFFDKTFWTINKKSPYFFSPARNQIRYILEPNHLKIQAQYPKPFYVSYHSLYDDEIAPADEKKELYRLLKHLEFDVKFILISNESQLDGKFIKSLSHGMDMSIKTLICKEVPPMLEKIQKKALQNSLKIKKTISYPCEDLLYVFSEKKDQIHLQIKEKND